MHKIKGFIKYRRHPVYLLEYKMASAYRSALEDLESAKMDFENPFSWIDAEKRVAEIRWDIEIFMDILGSYSRLDVAERLHRCELDIANAKRKARIVRKKAIQENPGLSFDEVERLEIVQASFSRRDSLIKRSMPIVADSKRKLQTAREILIKYG
jgi:hypothetical protein